MCVHTHVRIHTQRDTNTCIYHTFTEKRRSLENTRQTHQECMIFISACSALLCGNGVWLEARLHLLRPWILTIPGPCLALRAGPVFQHGDQASTSNCRQVCVLGYLGETRSPLDPNSEPLSVAVSPGNPETAKQQDSRRACLPSFMKS